MNFNESPVAIVRSSEAKLAAPMLEFSACDERTEVSSCQFREDESSSIQPYHHYMRMCVVTQSTQLFIANIYDAKTTHHVYSQACEVVVSDVCEALDVTMAGSACRLFTRLLKAAVLLQTGFRLA